MDTSIAPYWLRLLPGMFSMFEEALSPATNAHMRVIATLDLLQVENWICSGGLPSVGRPKSERSCFLRAFVAKAVLGIQTNVALIDRLKVDFVLRRICGWVFKKTLPCEATFSNCFSEFSKQKLPEKIHETLVKKQLENDIVFHISRDSTAINGRELCQKQISKPRKEKKPRGRPKKGEIRPCKKPTRLQKQIGQSLNEMLSDIPKKSDYGAKMDSHGNLHVWAGYKFHMDVADGGIPISCILTSASVHDSGLSLPLEKMTNQRVISLYTLADKAYDAPEIYKNISGIGKVPIIAKNKRRNEIQPELTSAEKIRFKERSTVERANSALKDRFGGRFIWVKGSTKVMCHLMFGILALTAEALLRTQ